MKITSIGLIVFTIFMQTAAGLVLASELARLRSSQEEKKLFSLCLPVALVITLVGLAASITHLASPLAAVYVLNNIFASALSLEIFCALLFAASLALCCYLRYRNPLLGAAPGLITAALGVLMIWSIANVYMKETIPTFNTLGTLTAFLETGLLVGAALGSLVYAVALKRSRITSDNRTSSAMIFLAVAIVGIGLGYLGTPFNTIARDSQDNFGINGLDIIMGSTQYNITILLSIGLPVVGVLMLVIAWLKLVQQQKCNTFAGYSVVAVIFVLAGEICGRYIFYETYLRLGI